ncbi:MAG: ribonuclease J, partial [Clostridia bacterium]
GNIVLKDRLAMAEDGIVIVSVGLDTLSGKIIKEPEIVSRGCIYAGEDGSNKTLEELKYQLSSGLKQPDLSELNANSLKNAILRVVKNYFRLTFKRNPMVIPIVMEI